MRDRKVEKTYMIYDNVLDAIGRTPLIRLSRMVGPATMLPL